MGRDNKIKNFLSIPRGIYIINLIICDNNVIRANNESLLCVKP